MLLSSRPVPAAAPDPDMGNTVTHSTAKLIVFRIEPTSVSFPQSQIDSPHNDTMAALLAEPSAQTILQHLTKLTLRYLPLLNYSAKPTLTLRLADRIFGFLPKAYPPLPAG